ncbi:hypothetical protein [Palleronia sp. THAF1]|uniref:hypothetical protein n=1 Tax=Palleronia sp. THAF1 TaxID=2587842 RepID=UPI0011CE8E56|nr:hypothetical protein [Palleronia sp. THAF1]
MRLQKGNPDKAFRTERSAHLRLSNRGLPVPRLLRHDDEAFVTADSGPNLQMLVRKGRLQPAEQHDALLAAATGLGVLHAAGVSHGRPGLKDICWKDGRVTFVDFERALPRRDIPSGHAMDALVFFHSLLSEIDDPATIDGARAVYVAAAPDGISDIAARRVRLIAPIIAVLHPLLGQMNHKAEFRAIIPTVALFRAQRTQ